MAEREAASPGTPDDTDSGAPAARRRVLRRHGHPGAGPLVVPGAPGAGGRPAGRAGRFGSTGDRRRLRDRRQPRGTRGDRRPHGRRGRAVALRHPARAPHGGRRRARRRLSGRAPAVRDRIRRPDHEHGRHRAPRRRRRAGRVPPRAAPRGPRAAHRAGLSVAVEPPRRLGRPPAALHPPHPGRRRHAGRAPPAADHLLQLVPGTPGGRDAAHAGPPAHHGRTGRGGGVEPVRRPGDDRPGPRRARVGPAGRGASRSACRSSRSPSGPERPSGWSVRQGPRVGIWRSTTSSTAGRYAARLGRPVSRR